MAEPAPTPRTETGTAPAISLTGVTRVFGSQPAIVGVRLEVGRGEVVLLRGANGAGKSTLLRVLATALSPTYGGGAVLGFDLVSERDEIRRRTELLTHRTRLYEELTAAEMEADAARFGTLGILATDGERLMLLTNLSTRPFYNVRAVRALIAALGAVRARELARRC